MGRWIILGFWQHVKIHSKTHIESFCFVFSLMSSFSVSLNNSSCITFPPPSYSPLPLPPGPTATAAVAITVRAPRPPSFGQLAIQGTVFVPIQWYRIILGFHSSVIVVELVLRGSCVSETAQNRFCVVFHKQYHMDYKSAHLISMLGTNQPPLVL